MAIVFVALPLVAAGLVWLRNRRTPHGGLFIGADNRVSTSKAIAVAWTVIVAWMVVSEALVAALPAHPPDTFSGLLSSASDLYFVFLGGPFAAAAFAKASVQSKVAQGTLTKPAGTPALSDLISDDNGGTDLYDFQYVLFNILALLIVVISFSGHPENGLPDVPSFLAILTGGSALTYTVNKAIATGGAQITKVDPPTARIGDVIVITGTGLVSTTAGAPLPTVTVGGISATGITASAGPIDTVIATVAAAPAGTTRLTGAVYVVVTPPQASPLTSTTATTIVADQPAITQMQPQPVTEPGLITVTGTLLLAPGTPPGSADPGTSSVGGLTSALAVFGSSWPVSIEGPYSDTELTLRIGTPPAPLGPGTTGDATLTLTRGTLQSTAQIGYAFPGITSVSPPTARAGDVIVITGVGLVSVAASAALPTVTVGGIGATVLEVSAGPTDTVTATIAQASAGTQPMAGAVDVVITPPQASPITSSNAVTVIADQPAITQVQPEPITEPGLITVTGTLLLAPGTPPGTADPDTSSIGGLTPELAASGNSWPVTIEGSYSDDELTLRIGALPAPLGPGATGDATLTLTRGTLECTTQIRYQLP